MVGRRKEEEGCCGCCGCVGHFVCALHTYDMQPKLPIESMQTWRGRLVHAPVDPVIDDAAASSQHHHLVQVKKHLPSTSSKHGDEVGP